MSQRNDYDYFDLDNFDDGYDSREYRRRQPQRRQGNYNRKPVYNRNRRNTRKRNKTRMRNRIIIILSGILILIVLIVLLSVMFKGCSGNSKETNATVSRETISTTAPASTQDTANTTNLADELSPTVFNTPKIEDDGTNGTSAYNIYVWKNIGFELFGSDETKAKKYATTINGFADKFGSDVKVYDMVVPNHTEMGLPQRLKDGDAPSGSQADNIKSMYANLSSKVTPVNCYNLLAEHNSEYIYFKSDHHWTGLGSYYAYTAFAKSTNQPVLSLENCTEKTVDGFTGSFSNTASGLDSDTVHYWEFPYDVTMDITYDDGTVGSYESPYYQYATSGANTYGVFIMGDNTQTVLKSSSENAQTGKKIAVVKESYGNAFVPYLTYNYEEVHVLDFRYFRQNLVTYCQQNGITDVLFLNGVMSANTQIQLDSMSGMFN